MGVTLPSRSHGVRLAIAPPAVRDASVPRAYAPARQTTATHGIYRKNDTQLLGVHRGLRDAIGDTSMNALFCREAKLFLIAMG